MVGLALVGIAFVRVEVVLLDEACCYGVTDVLCGYVFEEIFEADAGGEAVDVFADDAWRQSGAITVRCRRDAAR